jgi:hypothetical protein
MSHAVDDSLEITVFDSFVLARLGKLVGLLSGPMVRPQKLAHRAFSRT